MRILAIETSGRVGSVAVLSDDRLLEERRLPADQRTARTLAPAIRELLGQADWRPQDVQLIAVATGPGSFTGLRLGVTTAKTLAYAAATQLLGIHTLEAIAHRAPAPLPRLHVAIPAERNQVFAGLCTRHEEGLTSWISETRIVGIDDWIAATQPGDRVTGTALETVLARLPVGVEAMPSAIWLPTASAVGQLAFRQYLAGSRHDPLQLVPSYYRKSAAEEKRLKS